MLFPVTRFWGSIGVTTKQNQKLSGAAKAMETNTTIDGLLNGRIKIEQPKKGYRVAVDTLLLAAAVPARPGDRVLDMGCGAGGAMLSLACRIPGVKVTGVETQEDLALLCRRNIERNKMDSVLEVEKRDVTLLPDAMGERFDHVMMNPPYHEEFRHKISAHPGKRRANTETEGGLAAWIAAAHKVLRNGGTLTLIHRYDRKEEIKELLRHGFGAFAVKPVVTKKGFRPKRVIIRAAKNEDLPQRLSPPLVLQDEEGRYTGEAEAVLRHAGHIEL